MVDQETSDNFHENLKQYLNDIRLALIKSLELYNEYSNLYKSTMQTQFSQISSYFGQDQLMKIHQNAKRTVITQVLSLLYTFSTKQISPIFFNAR